MKKVRILFCAVALLAAFRSDEPVSKLNGVYKMSRSKHPQDKDWVTADDRFSIIVLQDGYWFVAKLKKGNEVFNGMAGGTYDLSNGKYNNYKEFYSWDSTAVGTTIAFDYKITPTEFHQSGVLNTAKYPHYELKEIWERIVPTEPLIDKGLEGVWFMQEGYWGGQSRFGEGKYKGFSMVKIFAYPYAVYAYYDPVHKVFDGGGVVRYQFDGKTLTETNELWSWDMTRRGKVETHKISLQNGKMIQEGWEGKLREVFAKAK